MKFVTRSVGVATTAFLALGLALTGASESSAKPIKLTMVGSWPPKVSSAADMGIKFKDTVNKLGAGKVFIEFKGSRDVIPTFDQPEALVRGLFDVWYGAANYWAGVVPGGHLTEMSHYDIPDNGPDSELFQFVSKLFERHGIRYLGHFSGDPSTGAHYMYTQKKNHRHRRPQGQEDPGPAVDAVLRQGDRRRAGDAAAGRDLSRVGARNRRGIHVALL